MESWPHQEQHHLLHATLPLTPEYHLPLTFLSTIMTRTLAGQMPRPFFGTVKLAGFSAITQHSTFNKTPIILRSPCNPFTCQCFLFNCRLSIPHFSIKNIRGIFISRKIVFSALICQFPRSTIIASNANVLFENSQNKNASGRRTNFLIWV